MAASRCEVPYAACRTASPVGDHAGPPGRLWRVERRGRRFELPRAYPGARAGRAGLDASGGRGGVLRGVPFAVKDIFDTADMPSGYGSPIYTGCRPGFDASAVALPRAAGAILLGKTVTTEFANRHPGPTSNPHNRMHTPGGSSSGSAAAVADFMVPLALG